MLKVDTSEMHEALSSVFRAIEVAEHAFWNLEAHGSDPDIAQMGNAIRDAESGANGALYRLLRYHSRLRDEGKETQ